jgi:hypothetical protein
MKRKYRTQETERTTERGMVFDPKQRVHSSRTADHCDWPKIKESFDNVQTQWAWPCYWGAAIGRPGAQEKTGYVHTAHKIRWKQMHFLTKFLTILETHISLRLHRPTKNSKTNPILINSHIYWVKYNTKRSRVKNKRHCKYNPYLCLFTFPFYFNYLHIIITLYKAIMTF